MSAEDGGRIKGIAFRAASTELGDTLLRSNDAPLHVAGTLGIDSWQGRENVQIRVTDVAVPRN